MSARTVLTKPPDPKKPGALDNINDDLIVSVGDVLVSSIGIRYDYVFLSGIHALGSFHFWCVPGVK